MNISVVDASVALKWELAEIHSENAARVLTSGAMLVAPDLIYVEIGNALWQHVRRGNLSLVDAGEALQELLRAPVVTFPSKALLPLAFDFAAVTGRSVYDSLYLAAAGALQAQVVTADARLNNALAGGPWAHLVLWIWDV